MVKTTKKAEGKKDKVKALTADKGEGSSYIHINKINSWQPYRPVGQRLFAFCLNLSAF